MAIIACVFGLLHAGSIWYPINLLAAVLYSQSQSLSDTQLNAFHGNSFLIATALHLLGSGLVGLVYGAMLPMLPRRPILLGGLIAPVLWSGLLWAVMNLLNPLLSQHIDWVWFVASQVAFGVTAGMVVIRHLRVPTRENVPFAIRAGVEAPGIMKSRGWEEGPR
jgi:MFS family permease